MHAAASSHIAAKLLQKPLKVEFGRAGSSAAAGYVDEDTLLDALRVDFKELLNPKYRDKAARGATVLQVVQMPSRAYIFPKFASAFATQVVPTQVMLFRSKAHYFNVLHIDRFGLE